MKSKYTVTKLACYVAYVVQAIVNNFLPILFIVLQDTYGLTYEELARILVFNFVTQMVTDFSAPKILSFTGYRGASVLAHVSASFGLVLLGVLPQVMSNTYLAIIISMVITAFGSGLIEVILSPMMEMLPTSNKAGNMAIMHSFYCWGQAFTIIATTLMVGLLGFKGWMWIPIVWAVIPFINIFAFTKVPIVEPEKDEKKDSFFTLMKDSRFILFLVMMLCAGASEITMAQWASMFAQQSLGVSKAIGDLAGPCAFAIFMGAGRIWYAKVSQKVSFYKTVIVLNILCFLCYVIVGVCNVASVSLICCALCGFTVSIFWPGTYSAGAKIFTNGGAVMFSAFAMLGDIGCSLGPWILGITADLYGLNWGFLTSAIFPVLMIISVILLMRTKKYEVN